MRTAIFVLLLWVAAFSDAANANPIPCPRERPDPTDPAVRYADAVTRAYRSTPARHVDRPHRAVCGQPAGEPLAHTPD